MRCSKERRPALPDPEAPGTCQSRGRKGPAGGDRAAAEVSAAELVAAVGRRAQAACETVGDQGVSRGAIRHCHMACVTGGMGRPVAGELSGWQAARGSKASGIRHVPLPGWAHAGPQAHTAVGKALQQAGPSAPPAADRRGVSPSARTDPDQEQVGGGQGMGCEGRPDPSVQDGDPAGAFTRKDVNPAPRAH
jgi:hypothetical protein